jgi:hypothetical protein
MKMTLTRLRTQPPLFLEEKTCFQLVYGIIRDSMELLYFFVCIFQDLSVRDFSEAHFFYP